MTLLIVFLRLGKHCRVGDSCASRQSFHSQFLKFKTVFKAISEAKDMLFKILQILTSNYFFPEIIN